MKIHTPGEGPDSGQSQLNTFSYQKLRNPVHTEILLHIYKMVNEKPHIHQYKVKTITADFPISEGCLKDGFFTMFGLHYSDYILQQYMGKAARLLAETDDTLENISEELGFNALSAFSRSFKKFHGVAPLKYRLQKQSQMVNKNP